MDQMESLPLKLLQSVSTACAVSDDVVIDRYLLN